MDLRILLTQATFLRILVLKIKKQQGKFIIKYTVHTGQI